jgi:hypothetical protein
MVDCGALRAPEIMRSPNTVRVMLVAVVVVLTIIVLAVAWYKGKLNRWLPHSMQHEAFCGVPSTLDPNVPCMQPGDPTYYNACGH